MDVKKNPQAKDLILKCLHIPDNTDVWDNGGWGYAIEMLPDALTSTAARLLPSFVEPGESEVMQKVCIPWLKRMFCFHGYFSWDVGDHPNTTSNWETVLQILRSYPSCSMERSCKAA